MALTATIFHVGINLSDVDRGVYAELDLRLARHPSETSRFMLLRLLAYCLSYEEGIAFSKGGLSSADEPPVAIHDPTGVLLAWIDVGSPSAERLHKASKAARRVAVFSAAELGSLRREAARQRIHRIEDIAVYLVQAPVLDALEAKVEKRMSLDVLYTDGQLYVTAGGDTIAGTVTRASLVADARGG